MEIEEIKDGRLNGVHERLAIESMCSLTQTVVDPAEIPLAHKPLLGTQAHNRIHEQRQLPLDSIVGLRSTQFDERRRDIQHPHHEIIGRPQIGQQLSLADYHQVALAQHELLAVELKDTAPPSGTRHAPDSSRSGRFLLLQANLRL